MKNIGLYAGAFDPVHDGHIEVARSALEFLELDDVYLMVEQRVWSDKKPIALRHRIEMVERAVANHAHIAHLPMDDARFTIGQTLPKLEQQFSGDQLFFMFGADVFLQMNDQQWPGLAQLLRHNIIVFERGNASESDIMSRAKLLGVAPAILPSTHPHHSSTDVRSRIHDMQLWLPEPVADYIAEHGLFR